MKAVRAVLSCAIFSALCGLTFAQDTSPSPESLRAMLQAKKVYIISGHVKYWKTKGFIKKELVDSTPFEEPCRKELEKWGRFTIVSDLKDADLVVRAYEKGNVQNVPMISPGVTGSVNVGQSWFILDVWQPSNKKVIWSASKNVGTSWSTQTGIASLVKRLRECIEEQERSGPIATPLLARTGSPAPALEVNNAAMFQKAFIAVKADEAYQVFEWPGFYEISNPSENPISITEVQVAWAPASFAGKQVSLVVQSRPGEATVFQSKDAIMGALRQHQQPATQKFPISIPARSTWYVEIPFLFELSDGQKSLRFADESEAIKWLSGALGWQPGQDGKFRCTAEDVSVEISTADGKALKYRPHTVLLVPGCLLNMPPAAKPLTSRDWQKYSFPDDGIEFSSPSAPTLLKQDQHSHVVNLGNSFVIFAVEQAQQNEKDYPAVPVKTFLEAAKTNFLQARKYELVSGADAALYGTPGTEFEAKNDKFRCRVRLFLAKEELISAEIVGPVAAPLPADAGEVLNSLRLVPAVQTPSRPSVSSR
jgi:hypothetical protein